MKLEERWRKVTRQQWLVLFVFLVGVAVRVCQLGSVPTGFNQDEAYAAYESFSMLHYGTDSYGYTNPCYLVAWGSGMNALESYLAMPFMAIFGATVTAFRMPQMIVSCFSLWVFYVLMKKWLGASGGCIALLLLAVSPWHIMYSRWGLECNLAPGFLLFGLYFLVKGLENNRWFLVAAVSYGLALYSYSITWIVVPVTLLLFAGYILWSRQEIKWKYVLLTGIILFMMALPLMIFLLVNKGIVPEIVTPFISIPKMIYLRDSELVLSNLLNPSAYYHVLNMLLTQSDGLAWNAISQFGLFYMWSVPLIVLGLVKVVVSAWQKVKNREFAYEILILCGMLTAFFTAVMISNSNINKVNSLHMYTAMLLAVGVHEIWVKAREWNVLRYSLVCAYGLSFMLFASFYFGEYNSSIAWNFRQGVEESVQFAKKQDGDTIYVDSSIYYPQILFFDQTPTPNYLETVEFANYPSAYLRATSFENYVFGIDTNQLDQKQVYIIKQSDKTTFQNAGFQVELFGQYGVAYG